jgi:hypothetical protein
LHAQSILSKLILWAWAFAFLICHFISKQVVRGALTNGREWIFLLVKLNDNGNGASFMQSDIIHLYVQQEGLSGGPQVMIRPFPDLIAGILSHWVSLTQSAYWIIG